MGLQSLNHVNIDTALPDETLAFYCDVLGMDNRPEERPDFGFPGAWLFLGDIPVVHLNFLEKAPASTTGAFNHVAFEGSDFEGMKQRLDANAIAFKASERPEIHLKQIFANDPNGVTVEINIRGE